MSWTECMTQKSDRSCPSFTVISLNPSLLWNLAYSRNRDPETPRREDERWRLIEVLRLKVLLSEGWGGFPRASAPRLPLIHAGGKGQVCLICLVFSPRHLCDRPLLSLYSLKLHFTVDRRPCVERQLVRRGAGPTILPLIRFYDSRGKC